MARYRHRRGVPAHASLVAARREDRAGPVHGGRERAVRAPIQRLRDADRGRESEPRAGRAIAARRPALGQYRVPDGRQPGAAARLRGDGPGAAGADAGQSRRGRGRQPGLRRRPTARLAHADTGGPSPGVQPGQRLLLCPDRRPCPACARRPRSARQNHHQGPGRRRTAGDAPVRPTLRLVLALPAAALDCRLRAADRVGRHLGQHVPRACHLGAKLDMDHTPLTTSGQVLEQKRGWGEVASDWASDQRTFKSASWGKAMMWIFLLSDTFIFSCFLISYMTVRMSTTVPWPNPSEVFSLEIGETKLPLLLIAIMTFVLISSSGTMAMAVACGYRRARRMTVLLLGVTALLGAAFVGMQAFEWTKLIREGVRPWTNPWGAHQFGSTF